jgi:chemotaxis protein MotD
LLLVQGKFADHLVAQLAAIASRPVNAEVSSSNAKPAHGDAFAQALADAAPKVKGEKEEKKPSAEKKTGEAAPQAAPVDVRQDTKTKTAQDASVQATDEDGVESALPAAPLRPDAVEPPAPDTKTTQPATENAQPQAATGKAIPQQAFAKIVAAAKTAEQAANVVPLTVMMKTPAGDAKDVSVAAKDAPAPRVSVTTKDAASAPLSVVSDKTARALSDMTADSGNDDASQQDTQHQSQLTQAPEKVVDTAAPVAAKPAAAPVPAAQPSTPQSVTPAVQPALAASQAASSAAAMRAPAPQTDADIPTNVTNLAAVIAAKALSGAKSFEIRLDPAELGRVEVQLNVDRDGKADATITAHRPETLALLMGDSRNLERTLKDAGLDVSNSSLNFSLKGEGRQGDGGGASRAHTRTLSDAVVARSEAANASIASLSLAPSSARLDIRV